MAELPHNESLDIHRHDYLDDYRSFLEHALRARKGRNSSYSLRAFARDLGLSASRLTEIFQRKDGLSGKRAIDVADRLGLTAFERERFLTLVDLQSGRSPLTRRLAKVKLAAMSEARASVEMRDDCIAMLAGWHHFAILELSRTPGFRSDPMWISKRMRLSLSEVTESLDRLVRFGLLKRMKTRLVPTSQRFATTSDVSSAAIRDYHAGILKRAIACVDEQGVEEREYGASLFPVHTSQIAAMKDEIRAARRQIVKKYEYSKKKESSETGLPGSVEVYCIAGQLFRVSHEENRHESNELH